LLPTGLPDGMFAYQKSQFGWLFWKALEWKMLVYLEYFMAICSIFATCSIFDIWHFCSYLVGTMALCQPTECQPAECQPTECQFYNI
jgi:hypothetical protein